MFENTKPCTNSQSLGGDDLTLPKSYIEHDAPVVFLDALRLVISVSKYTTYPCKIDPTGPTTMISLATTFVHRNGSFSEYGTPKSSNINRL